MFYSGEGKDFSKTELQLRIWHYTVANERITYGECQKRSNEIIQCLQRIHRCRVRCSNRCGNYDTLWNGQYKW